MSRISWYRPCRITCSRRAGDDVGELLESSEPSPALLGQNGPNVHICASETGAGVGGPARQPAQLGTHPLGCRGLGRDRASRAGESRGCARPIPPIRPSRMIRSRELLACWHHRPPAWSRRGRPRALRGKDRSPPRSPRREAPAMLNDVGRTSTLHPSIVLKTL